MWVLVRGGLGNQMFQAALALALAKRFGVRPRFVDLTDRARVQRGWQLDCFGMSPTTPMNSVLPAIEFGMSLANALRRIGGLSLPGVAIENSLGELVEFSSPPLVLSGYWQRAQYFEGYEDDIRSHFRFPPTQPSIQIPTAAQAPKVAIHMRRGDYVTDPAAQIVHLVCNDTWYRQAWCSTQEAVPGAHGYVFSDDPDWALACLGPSSNLTYMPFSPNAHPSLDLALMAQCDHFIISNSSFSWWGAWLGRAADKRVIAPREWFRGRPTEALGICPTDWLLL